MPHIKSIRLANVHFNNATQFYDDFVMELGGKNATYDLENGGGKSLLLLMILQTVLPKSYLRREKPISLLFQGGKDRTSHVAVEWILEEGSSYKYLLTGFCARKRKGSNEPIGRETVEDEVNLQSGDIEHLNWCVFYNDDKITGIKGVPFIREEAGKKSYAGFEDIRKYIQQMKQKALPAEMFDGIDKYQGFISAHNLIAAEWNIIKGINSGENTIESYFRQNATSRKLIENQFVKIVEDVEALNRGEKNNDESLLLADTLIEIRSRLDEYLRLKEHMAEFERIKEYYSEFGKRNDDLLNTFKDYEACKLQAVSIRNFIEDKLKILEKEKAEAIKSIEYNTASSKEGANLKKLLEAGLVNYEKNKLLAEKQQLEADKHELDKNYKELEKQYNQAMTLEGYGEYRTIKSKLSETGLRLKAHETDADDLKVQHRAAGGRLKFLSVKLCENLSASLENTVETQSGIDNGKKKNQELHIAEARKESVLESAINELIEKETVFGERLKDLNGFFLARGEIDAVLSPEQFLVRTEKELNGHLLESDSISERMKSIDTRAQSLELGAEKIVGEINNRFQLKKRDQEWLIAYQNELSELKKRSDSFGNSTIQQYKEGLELLIYKENLNKLEKEIETARLRQKKQLSEDRGYYVPNEEVLSLAGQLSNKCEFVKAGIDWIAESKPDEKEVILREMPYLPFSVIVDRISFEKLKNKKLKLDFSSDYPIPIVNLETVRSMKNQTKEDVYYFCSFSELVIANNIYEQYIESIEATLKNTNNELSTAESRISELNCAYFEVAAFFVNYSKEQVECFSVRVKDIEEEITVLENRRVHINEEKNRILEEKASLSKRIEELSRLINDCRDKIKKLLDCIDTAKELTNIRERLSGKRREFETLKKAISNIRDEAKELENQYKLVQEQIGELKIELHDGKIEKDQLSSFEEALNNIPIFQARADYKALQESVSGRTVEEDELRSRLKEYEARLAVLTVRILRDYEGDLEQVEKSEENGAQIIIPSQDFIKNVKLNKEEKNGKLKAIEAKIIEIYSKITNAEGMLGVILKDLPEAILADLPCYDSVTRYRQELEYVVQLIKSYDEEIKGINEELERQKEEIGRLNNQAWDYNLFIEREAVENDGSIASETKDFRLFEREYHRFKDNIHAECSKWNDRIKSIKDETTAYIIREPLEELEKISQPGSSRQCLDRKEAFAEYIMNIEEQIQKISNDILQLESYQQDFTRRCIQRAELVLGHLRKLEPLSRIEIYGRRTNMIELKLREFEEKEKHLRMKFHINSIVKEISEEGAVDRKRVAAKLSTKELLAQITDMDKAAVKLYKIESIPENSKSYRWENAIGSEGQNNSLYFIFAACLISFIRMLSITNTSLKTKKVIIADNPFGSTSAAYLWDPMFKIMKQNDIQLIAPGHRIPREITSKFGVSYLLNQDILQDGRMRVVVKDVQIEEDEYLLRYVEPKQLSML